MKQISKLQYITTSADLARMACEAGVDWIQLRLKNITYEAYKTTALDVLAVCREHQAKLIINDNVSLALDIGADGVHIGKEDMPLSKARAILGNDYIIGCTANTLEDLRKIAKGPADYIGLGPYRFTTTKEKLSPVLGLQGYHTLFEQLIQEGLVIPPVVGIGGICAEDVPLLLETGLHGVAVSAAISQAPKVKKVARAFVELCNHHTIKTV
ncbi:thiamine phosphate synthase [Asinibacterium sp. OR53]|uniref:thiamine phosphate synthase n=1 Tax=Asinibacterium sp. OR53 TaxID=925409 RepID=UPI0004B2DEF3|nr:thiamine phosphate synthase [Asinibacterium sp. OR53]